MDFGLLNIISLVGALGLFIFGMKVMSEALQKVAGTRLRRAMEAMTATPSRGVLTGFLLTAIVQSSSATTVMIVSFVNAGLLSLLESISLILGANLGTTITAWLVAVVDMGRFSVTALSLPVVAVALPLLFIPREKTRLWSEVLMGFAILFLGLALIRETLPDISVNPGWLSFVQDFSYTDRDYFSGLLVTGFFVLIGVVITLLVQSSSAAIALTLVLTAEGWLSFPLAAAIVLGENIGTTITANLAALVANVHAKRAARAHFLFNFFGSIGALLLFPGFIALIAHTSTLFFGVNPLQDTAGVPLALCLFHTSFNLFNLLIFLRFRRALARMSTALVRSRSHEDELYSLDYIGSGLMATPELSIIEARKELVKFADLMRRSFKYIPLLITEMDEKKLSLYVRKLQKYEDISDRMEMEISNYLGSASRDELSAEASRRVRMMLHIANYLERMGDIYLEISRNLTNRKEQKAYFTQEMRQRVLQLSELVARSLDQMVKNLESKDTEIDLAASAKLEQEINQTFRKFRSEYIEKVEKGKYRVQSGMYYSDLLSEMERIADHAASISDALKVRAASPE